MKTGNKRIWLNIRISEYKKAAGRSIGFQRDNAIMILIERDYFLRDSFRQFNTRTDLDLRKDLKIYFINECSQDAGGLIREWFTILTEEFFSSKLGLFVRTQTPQVAYTININSDKHCEQHLNYFYFIGQILAKALFENIAIKAYLCRPLFKLLTNTQLKIEDLKYIDIELWKSVDFLIKNKVECELGNFTLTQKDPIDGKVNVVELKEGGKKIAITEENKNEFINLLWKYYLFDSVQSQCDKFIKGFFSLLHEEIIQALDGDELELFLCGDQKISLEDWKKHTKYKKPYNQQHQVILWFWEVLAQLTNAELERFLQFCTGSNKVPAEGFSGLTSNNGKKCQFVIEPKRSRHNGTDFIIAHTCFNKIELPMYGSMKKMKEAIKAIINSPACYKFSLE